MKRRRDDNDSLVELPYEKRRKRTLRYLPFKLARSRLPYVGLFGEVRRRRDVTSYAQRLASLPDEILQQIYHLSANFGNLMGTGRRFPWWFGRVQFNYEPGYGPGWDVDEDAADQRPLKEYLRLFRTDNRVGHLGSLTQDPY